MLVGPWWWVLAEPMGEVSRAVCFLPFVWFYLLGILSIGVLIAIFCAWMGLPKHRGVENDYRKAREGSYCERFLARNSMRVRNSQNDRPVKPHKIEKQIPTEVVGSIAVRSFLGAHRVRIQKSQGPTEICHFHGNRSRFLLVGHPNLWLTPIWLMILMPGSFPS